MRTHHSHHSTNSDTPYPRLDEELIRAVYRFVYQHVGNREDAESLTERACTEALRGARDLIGGYRLEDTLWQAARAVVAEHQRRFYGAPALDAMDTKDTPGDEQSDAPALIRDILAQLPTRERDFLTRRFLDNTALDAAAAALVMTQSEAQALQWCALIQAARIARGEKSCSPC